MWGIIGKFLGHSSCSDPRRLESRRDHHAFDAFSDSTGARFIGAPHAHHWIISTTLPPAALQEGDRLASLPIVPGCFCYLEAARVKSPLPVACRIESRALPTIEIVRSR